MSGGRPEPRAPLGELPRARAAPLLLATFILFMVLGGAGIVLGASAAHGAVGTATLVLSVLSFVAAIASVVTFGVHIDRTRTAGLRMVMDHLGLSAVQKPPGDQRPALFAPFAGLGMLRGGAKNLRVWAGGDIDGVHVNLIEHVYIVSTGKSAHAVTHTAIATPCPDIWPRLSLTPRHTLAKLWASVAGGDFRVENEAFNDRWIARTENPDFALVFLTPDVQSFLADAPPAETWHVAQGSVCRVVRKRLAPADIPGAIDRVVGLRRLLPPELDLWSP